MSTRKISKLIREEYPPDYTGYKFITLIQFNGDKFLTIVDRVTEKTISAYILDLCGPQNIDEETILNIAYEWSDSERKNFPISYEFARLQLTNETTVLHRSFNKDFIERVIGPLPAIEVAIATVKRKKRKKINLPSNTIITEKFIK